MALPRRVSDRPEEWGARQRETKRLYYEKNKTRERRRAKEWREANKEMSAASARKSGIKARYGLSMADLEDMHTACGGVCGICGEAISLGGPRGNAKAYVDHNHNTGSIRGLLCMCCNTALGKFRESREILGNAIAYLEKHNGE